MVLASFLRRFPDELRADFQQCYGLNLDDMGGSFGIGHAACLAAQLPPDSRTFSAADPLCAYATPTNRLLALIEYHAHAGWYVHTEDARRGRNRPRPVTERTARGTQGQAMEIGELREFLARPRREARHGG